MFRFHIGLPSLHENVFQNSVGWWDDLPERPYLLSTEDYDRNLASYINTRDKERSRSQGFHATAAHFLGSLTQFANVVVPIPQILGPISDAYATATPFPRAAGRIARLTKLLPSQDVEFHLLVKNPFDYFFPQSEPIASMRLAAVLAAKPSWVNLVVRLQQATLGRSINVWDFEYPEIMSARLRSMILGPNFEEPMFYEGEDFGDEQLALHEPVQTERAPVEYNESIIALDDRYEHELDQLEALPGVTLFRSPGASRN
jgi:hypothetical protein